MSVSDNLSDFELPAVMVEPAVRACRLFDASTSCLG